MQFALFLFIHGGRRLPTVYTHTFFFIEGPLELILHSGVERNFDRSQQPLNGVCGPTKRIQYSNGVEFNYNFYCIDKPDYYSAYCNWGKCISF